MLKKYLFIVAAIFAVIGFQSQAFAVPTSELVFTADMTEEQLQAELAKADDIEAAVTAAIVAGADAKAVTKAAIKAQPSNAGPIRNAAIEAAPASERDGIINAAKEAANEVYAASVSNSNPLNGTLLGGITAFLSLNATPITTGGGGLASACVVNASASEQCPG